MKHLSILLTMLFLASLGFAEKNETDTIKMQNLDEVVISASRTKAKLKELPAKVEVITAKAISQSTANDMADLLKNNTSLDLIQYGNFSSYVGMRGFAPGAMGTKYVTTLVNGLPSGSDNLATLPLGGIEQIEILRGPFSSLYGSSAMGGLINIVPAKHKDELTGKISLGYGSFNTWDYSVAAGGKLIGGLSFDIATTYRRQNDDYKIGDKNFYHLNATQESILDKKSYGATMEGTTYKSESTNARLGYDFNENWSLDLYGSYFKTDDVKLNNSFFNKAGTRGKGIKHYASHLILEGKIKKHLLKLMPYYSHYDYNYSDVTSGYETSKYATKTYGATLQDIISFSTHKLTFGIDSKNTNSESNQYNAYDKGKEIAPYQPDYTNNTLGGFTQADFKFFKDKLNLSAGARYDLIKLILEENDFFKNEEKSEDYNKFSPNIGFKYNFTKHGALHASFGQAFLAPDAFKKAGQYAGAYGITKGNPDLDGESSTTFDIGLGYKNIEQGIEIDATYFHTNHDDFIVYYYDNAGYSSYKNAKEAKMRGVEVTASYDFGALANYAFSLKAYMNGTFMLKNKVLDNDAWLETRNVSNETVNFGLTFSTNEKWNIGVNGRYLGSRIEDNYFVSSQWNPTVFRPEFDKLAMITQPFYANQGLIKYPHFMVFDAHVYYNITKHFTVGLNANNFLDENYTEKDGYNMPGRNFMGKVSYKF